MAEGASTSSRHSGWRGVSLRVLDHLELAATRMLAPILQSGTEAEGLTHPCLLPGFPEVSCSLQPHHQPPASGLASGEPPRPVIWEDSPCSPSLGRSECPRESTRPPGPAVRLGHRLPLSPEQRCLSFPGLCGGGQPGGGLPGHGAHSEGRGALTTPCSPVPWTSHLHGPVNALRPEPVSAGHFLLVTDQRISAGASRSGHWAWGLRGQSGSPHPISECRGSSPGSTSRPQLPVRADPRRRWRWVPATQAG